MDEFEGAGRHCVVVGGGEGVREEVDRCCPGLMLNLWLDNSASLDWDSEVWGAGGASTSTRSFALRLPVSSHPHNIGSEGNASLESSVGLLLNLSTVYHRSNLESAQRRNPRPQVRVCSYLMSLPSHKVPTD